MAIAVEHFHRQHKVFALIGIGDEQRFGGAILFAVVQVQLLHILVGVADPDEGAQLRITFGDALAQHVLLSMAPAVAEQVDAGRRTEEALLVAVGFLRHLYMETFLY